MIKKIYSRIGEINSTTRISYSTVQCYSTKLFTPKVAFVITQTVGKITYEYTSAFIYNDENEAHEYACLFLEI